ncbi:MAG: VOC family protein, partial [Pseudomonadota bacterium]
ESTDCSAKLAQITPFLRVSDMDAAVSFYGDVLGFRDVYRIHDPNYAFLKRDNAAVRLMQVDADFDLTRPEAQQVIYIDVDDIDALYNELRPRLDTLPRARLRGLHDTFYGQREFHVVDGDTILVMFGATRAAPDTETNTPSDGQI